MWCYVRLKCIYTMEAQGKDCPTLTKRVREDIEEEVVPKLGRVT